MSTILQFPRPGKSRRRQPTEEQKARAAERRSQFKALVKRVAAMSDEERRAFSERVGCMPTCEGRILSVHNTCLVLMQNPGASLVGGFRQWLAAGRVVRKGEHGLSIWIPCGAPKPVAGERPALDDESDDRTFFVMGTVFDVSQTAPAAESDGAE